MMFDDVVAQGFGFISLALGLSTFYQTDDKKMKIVMIILQVNHLVHFLLLGSIVSALSALLSGIRTALAIKISSKRVAALFIVLTLGSGIALADNIWQLWSIIGSVIGTYSVFLLKGIKLRIGFLIGSTCWLINNIIVGSIGGTLLEAAAICMNLITISRMYRSKENSVSTSN